MLKNRKYKTMKGGVNPLIEMNNLLWSIEGYVTMGFNKDDPKLTEAELKDKNFMENLEGLHNWFKIHRKLSYEYLSVNRPAVNELVGYLAFFYDRYYPVLIKTHSHEYANSFSPSEFKKMLLKLYYLDNPMYEDEKKKLMTSYNLLHRGIQHSLSKQVAENMNSDQ
jgi:hypothetical protein